MLRHYLLITLKHLWKRKLYSLITLLSLTLGLSVFSLIVLHVKRELSYNQGWPDSERIYRMYRQVEGRENLSATTFNASDILELQPFLEGQVEGYTEFNLFPTGPEEAEEGQNFGVNIALIDEGFFDVFSPELVEGSLAGVMKTPGLVALSQEFSSLLFGEKDSYLGETVSLSGARFVVLSPDFAPGSAVEYEVGAVYDLPRPLTNSATFGALTRRTAYSERMIPTMNEEAVLGRNIWLKLPAHTGEESIEDQLLTFVDEHSPYMRENIEPGEQQLSELYQYKLQSIGDIYFEPVQREFPTGDMGRVITFSIIGLFVLLAGCSNAVSLGLAGALERRREVGIRKAVGAVQGSIVLQYLGEAMLLAVLAMVPVLLVTEWLNPVFANLLSLRDLPEPGMQEITLLLAIAVLVGLVNGLYPAFVLARVKPVSVLKTHASQPRLHRINARTLLVGCQFTISVMLLVGTLALYTQLYFTRLQPLGFDQENLAQAFINFDAFMQSSEHGPVLAQRLETVPGIRSASSVFFSLNPGSARNLNQFVSNRQVEEGVEAVRENTVWGHFGFMGIPILAGREFEVGRDETPEPVESPEEASERVLPVVINRTAMKALGFESPEQALAKRFYMRIDAGATRRHNPMDVIGVVEDSRLNNIKARPAAEVYSLGGAISPFVLFRYDDAIADQLQELVSGIQVEVTGYPGDLSYIDDMIDQAYAEEQQESLLLLICAGLALFLSSIGLYGLVSVAMRSRVKEIGVRKALGATTPGVVGMFLKRYSVPVILANVVAWPVALYFVVQWLERFPYQLDKAWLLPVCLAAGAVTMTIALGTVGGLTWKAASARPVASLRDE